MQRRKNKIILGLFILLSLGAFFHFRTRQIKPNGELIREINPVMGSIQNIISTTATVLPKNRLEIKPPVNGRVDEILVREGEKVKTGQILAWMSSTERAALLDAARGQDEETLKYWKQVYKAIPLISPIDAEVIVAKTQPGQTVTASDPVIVLSNQLIIRAQVDETDIGKVKLGQNARITLDAYPDTKINAAVEHLYYESKTINNVTMYEVDLIPEETLGVFRSGMNAAVDFIETSRKDILLIPLEALHKEKDGDFVLVKNGGKEPLKRMVKTGISDDKNVEITSGITADDTIIIKSKRYALPKNKTGANPFMPSPRRNSGR